MEYRAILALREDPEQTKYIIVEDCVTEDEAAALIKTSYPDWDIEVIVPMFPL